MALFCVRHNERRTLRHPDSFGLSVRLRRDTDYGSRWRISETSLGFHAEWKNGSAVRSFATDAHDCIVVRVLGPTGYKVVARLQPRPGSGLSSDRHPDRT